MMARSQDDEESGPLCCCEYVNDGGEKSHLMALCCDCQEVDENCDRFFKCREIEKGSLVKTLRVISDRVRIPTCFGAGARRLDQLMDTTALPPVIIVPMWIYTASLHYVVTFLSFLIVPIAVLLYYRVILRHRQRTQFFMSWGLSSVFLIYGAFYFLISPNIDVTVFSAVTILFIFTMLAFFAAKHGPGVVQKQEFPLTKKNLFKVLSESTVVSDSVQSGVQKRAHSDTSGDGADGGACAHHLQETSDMTGGESQAYSSDSANQESEQWCDVCKLHRPERAGHCRICGHCVQRFDHHCVWIDSCVGAGNHRSFLLAALWFVIGGLWGAYLSLDHLCSLQLNQLPDCSHVYNNRRTAVIFVSIIYTVFAVACAVVLLLQQFHLITHNWTYRERKLAARSHRYGEALAERDNGFLRNWWDFLLMRVEEKPHDRASKLTVV